MPVNHQELVYAAGHHYRDSPHLKHAKLYDSLVAQVRDALAEVGRKGLEPSLLEIGAGEGSFVEPALAFGADVAVTEMSRHSIDTLVRRYGHNPRFSAVYDEDGSMAGLGDKRYAVILYASVLHHIPDYQAAVTAAVDRHLLPGGVFLSFQDPLWYPSLSHSTRIFNRVAYLSWRLTRGNYGRGFRTIFRRLRRTYDDANPSDTVEYHVVRNGVDHKALVRILTTRFDDVSLMTYWSTPSALWQRIGNRLGIKTTFALRADGYKGRGD